MAGRIVAVIYALCVLLPAFSFAFADGALAAPCLTDPDHAMGIMHVHDAAGAAQHVHHDGHDHGDHGNIAHHSAMQDSGMPSADARLPAQSGDGHKSPGAQCCGMVCISALPASLTEFVAPSAPTTRCSLKRDRSVAGNSPPSHYRPPIS